jgi:hypothetical protein
MNQGAARKIKSHVWKTINANRERIPAAQEAEERGRLAILALKKSTSAPGAVSPVKKVIEIKQGEK